MGNGNGMLLGPQHLTLAPELHDCPMMVAILNLRLPELEA